MIFAFIDYWKYRKRKGRYSHQALTNQGLNLATLDNFRNYKSYPLGHILFVSTTDSSLSWAIMYCTNSTLSHTAIFYGNGVLQDCTTSGVVRRSFDRYLDDKSYLKVIPPPGGTNFAHMREIMNQSLGARYNWLGAFRMLLNIIIGNHPGFSWRIYSDLLMMLLIASYIFSLAAPQSKSFLYWAAGSYPAIVLFNKIFRKKVLRPRP